jgi:hypothetical protein
MDKLELNFEDRFNVASVFILIDSSLVVKGIGLSKK